LAHYAYGLAVGCILHSWQATRTSAIYACRSLAVFEVTSSSLETPPESHGPLLPRHPEILQKQPRASAPGAKSSLCCQQRSPLWPAYLLASNAGFALFAGEDTPAELAAASSAGKMQLLS
jgi:hypothetical protein